MNLFSTTRYTIYRRQVFFPLRPEDDQNNDTKKRKEKREPMFDP